MPRHQGRCHARGGPPGFGSRDAVTGRLAAGLAGLVERARRGDAAALPELRLALDANPHLWQRFGDLARQAEQALVDLAAGNDLYLRECLARRVAELRGELGGRDAAMALTWATVHTNPVTISQVFAAVRWSA